LYGFEGKTMKAADVNQRLQNGDADSLRTEFDAIHARARATAKTDKLINKNRPPRFKLTAFNEIMLQTTAVYLIKGLIPRVGLTVIWGPPKCGKSFWTLDAFMHIAIGRQYRGRRVQQGPVVYLAPEGAHGFGARIEAYRQRHLSAHKKLVPFYLVPGRLDLIKDHPELIKCTQEQLNGAQPVAVVIDTLNRSLNGSESKDEDMAAYVQAADRIREVFGCAVIVIHHCGINDQRPRGHTSLTGAADAQLAVRRDASGNVVVEVEYMKDGAEGDIIVSRLERVEVGIDNDGDVMSSCVLVPVEGVAQNTAKQGKRSQLSKAAKTALRALVEAVDECGAVPPASNHIPAGVCTVSINQWRQYAYNRGISTGEERAKQQAFKRATDLLIANEHVGIWGEQVWPVT
jgi:AAA domain